MDIASVARTAHAVINTELFSIGTTPVSLGTLVLAAVIVAATFRASTLLQRVVQKALGRRGVLEEGAIAATSRLVHYAVVATGLAIALTTLGINLGALFAAGAVFAVGLAFAMQNIAQNFVSGIILLVERSIEPGDILQVEGRMVRVEEMGIRATIARTLDFEQLIIPNSTLVQNTVTNYTLRDSVIRINACVGVSYGSDVHQAKRVLEAACESLDWRFEERAPTVQLTRFADSAIEFRVSLWSTDPWNLNANKSRLHIALWSALRDAGIVIAYPQLDVHVDPPLLEALSGGRGGRRGDRELSATPAPSG